MANVATPAPAKAKKSSPVAIAFPNAFRDLRDNKKASAYIDETLSLYAEVGERLHVAACVALWHTVTHRNPALLNRLHSALRSNDQTALKLWIRRVQVTNGLILMNEIEPNAAIPTSDTGGPLAAEVIAEAEETGSVLAFENKQYAIVSDTVDAGKAMANLLVRRWFEPDGKVDSKVFVRNNIAELVTYTDLDALKAVLRVVDPKDTGRREVEISNGTRDLLNKIKDMITPRIKQFELASKPAKAATAH